MMPREKQIEEMAEEIFQNCNCGLFFSEAEKIARFVIEEQGYRKQSEPISCSHEKGGEWISVDERLPEQCVPVLVYKNRNGEAYGNMETTYFEKGRWRGSCGEFATHWMPLPKAPKMKRGKQE